MELDIPEYTIEIWDINGVVVADVSNIIATQLSMTFSLNDIEEINFAIDLVQFETLCDQIGANPKSILEPYRTEIRVSRNGSYICGAQVVQAQVNFNNSENNKIEIKATGYLNYFKDRFITTNYNGMTYAEISRQLIQDTQAQTNGDFGVTLGIDTASPSQQDDRERNYDLQNIKDAIINLTKLENDNFDFSFSPDKTFNIYSRLGSDKPGVELVYPQNVTSMNVERDASTLANKIIGIGSGIGEERLESIATDTNSAISYRIRERVELFSSIELQSTLDENTSGKLLIYKDIYEKVTLDVEPGELDINNVIVGDAITVRVDGSTFVDNVNGLYRIIKMSVNVDINLNEVVSLDLVYWG